MAVLTPPRVAQREAAGGVHATRQGATPPASAAPRRLLGADALRAVAAVAVIVIHASYWPLQNRGADDAVWGSVTLLARFAVPAFVMLTGLVLGFRYGDQRLGGAFLLRRARRSLLPWLIWAPIFCVADILWVGGVTPSWSGLAAYVSGGAGHLYFLILVPQLYVLLLAWPARRRPLALVTAGALALQVALSVVRLYVPMGSGAAHQLMLDHGFELFPFWIGYFALGVLAGRRLLERRGRGLPAWPFALAVPAAAALLLWNDIGTAANGAYGQGTGAFLRPLLPPFAVALSAAVLFGSTRVLARMPRLRATTDVLSRHSLGVYIVHPLLLTALGRMMVPGLRMHVPGSILPFLAITVLSGAGALAFSALLARTPLAMAVGEERMRPRRRREGELVGRRATPERAATR
jgi:probable poly-beta-1,6-N-acetyl-D-glucosamine export protein